MHALVLAVLLLAPETAAAPSPTWQAALAAYRKKDYARACPLFAEAARVAPDNGAIWADFGLCELKRGRKQESVRASMRAVLYGDAKTRMNAYYNLGLAGVALPVPPRGKCAVWQAPDELACPQRVEVCHDVGPGTGRVRQRGGPPWAENLYAVLARCGDGCPRKTISVDPGEFQVPLAADAAGNWVESALLVRGMDVQTARAEIEDEQGHIVERFGTGATIITECTVVVLDPCRGRAGLSCTRSEELYGPTRVLERFGTENAFGVAYPLTNWEGRCGAKGRFQDREYCGSNVIDLVVADGAKAIPMLIAQIADERLVPEPVRDDWPRLRAGELAALILEDLFLDEAYRPTMPELFADRRCVPGVPASACWTHFRERHSFGDIQGRWLMFWKENAPRIRWDENARCFRLSAGSTAEPVR